MTMPMLKDMDKDRLQWCKCVFRVLSVSFFSIFAWLELMSHRSFMPKLFIVNPPKGWPHVQCLLVDLFKFMEPPYPRSAELGETVCFFSSLKIGAISGRDHITEVEMIIAEEFWKIMKQHKQHPQSAFTLPRGVNEQQQESHRTTARESSSLNREQKQVAVLVLVIDQERERLPRAEELLPAKLLKRIEELARESKGCCCSKVFILIKDMGHIGRPMVEVFSVRINHIDGEKLYGTITVTDGLSTQSIYNRSRDHYESISLGQTTLLTGPARSISASDSFTIDVALKDKDKLSPDDDVSKWFGDGQLRSVEESARGYCGSYARRPSGKNSLPVYGLLTARNGNFMNESVLFRKKSDEHVDVRPEQSIPLSRSVVAVPSNSSLIVWAVLMDHNGEIAKGTAEFPAQLSGTAQ
ncbi:hypothetical protein ACSBR1_003489 [Camellia fascicularis]